MHDVRGHISYFRDQNTSIWISEASLYVYLHVMYRMVLIAVLSCICSAFHIKLGNPCRAEICLLCLLDPKYSQIRVGTHLLFISPCQIGNTKPQRESVICSYATNLELSVLILKETEVWYVVDTWGTEKRETQYLYLAGSSQSPWGTETNIQETIWKCDINYQALGWPTVESGDSFKRDVFRSLWNSTPCIVTLSLPYAYFIDLEILGRGGTFCLQDPWMPGPILLSFLIPSRMSKVPWKSKWFLYLSE